MEDDPQFVGGQTTTTQKSCAGRSYRFWFIIFAACALVVIAIGSILLPLGINQQKQVGSLDADSDFSVIEPDCNITEVIYEGYNQRRCSRKQGDSTVRYDCGCDDSYSYVISAPQLASIDEFYEGKETFKSIKETIDRRKKSCLNSSPAKSTFSVGNQTECWRPSSPTSEVHSYYRCGNEECIKMFSPQDDVDKANADATGLWVSGIIFLGLCVPFLVLSCVFYPRA